MYMCSYEVHVYVSHLEVHPVWFAVLRSHRTHQSDVGKRNQEDYRVIV